MVKLIIMTRVYKEDSPQNTILKIKKILSKIGIVTYESFYAHPHENIYSCRTELIDSQGTFGQNGKGMSSEYALASSHAEFMERLQNGFLFGMRHLSIPFIRKIKDKENFIYFPDEKLINKQDFFNLPEGYLLDIFGDICQEEMRCDIEQYFEEATKNGFDGITAIPFYSCYDDKLIYLPYNLTLMITGSNGMSAGNSENEGVFQGLCEIIERAAASTVYNQNLTPPTIPIEFIKNNQILYNTIKEIEKQGYDVIVKDFSAGYNLPVVGTLIINKKKKKYRLNVGADTCFDVALSRTLTEIHQGISNKKDLESIMLDIPRNKRAKKNTEKFTIDEDLEKFFQDGTGVFTSAIFDTKESYLFNESTFCDSQDYNSGCKYLIKLIESLEAKVFIRDTSFLGFPSFYIYVPKLSCFRNKGISNQSFKMFDVKSNISYGQIEKHLYNFKNIFENQESMRFLIQRFTPSTICKYDPPMCDLMKIEIKASHYWSSIPISYFLTMFSFILKDYSMATEYLKIYLKTMKLEKDSYYKKVMNFFYYLKQNKSNEFIIKNVDEDIISSFSVENIKSELAFPNCPNCEDCKINHVCNTYAKIKIFSSMQKEMKLHDIDQMKFSKIFKDR